MVFLLDLGRRARLDKPTILQQTAGPRRKR